MRIFYVCFFKNRLGLNFKKGLGLKKKLAKAKKADYETAHIAALAQLVEHLIRNEGVGGSNPSSGTIFIPFLFFSCSYSTL